MSGKRMKHVAAAAAAALALAGAAVITAASSAPAAPLVPSEATVTALASTRVTEAYYRRGCCGRRYYGHRFYRPAYPHWRHGYRYTDCGYTFPATCGYPYPYFGFVYGWHGIW